MLNIFQYLFLKSRKFESFAEFVFAIQWFLRNIAELNFMILRQIRKNKFSKNKFRLRYVSKNQSISFFILLKIFSFSKYFYAFQIHIC